MENEHPTCRLRITLYLCVLKIEYLNFNNTIEKPECATTNKTDHRYASNRRVVEFSYTQ